MIMELHYGHCRTTLPEIRAFTAPSISLPLLMVLQWQRRRTGGVKLLAAETPSPTTALEQPGGKMVVELVEAFNELMERMKKSKAEAATLSKSSSHILFKSLKLSIPILRSLPLAPDGRSSLSRALSLVLLLADLQGIARRLVKAAMLEAAKKREMRYSDLKKIQRGVRRHFHDDITVIVVFLDQQSMSRSLSQNCSVSVKEVEARPSRIYHHPFFFFKPYKSKIFPRLLHESLLHDSLTL